MQKEAPQFIENKIPENNILERRFGRLFHLLGMVTTPSKIRGESKKRSLLDRRNRKEALDKLNKRKGFKKQINKDLPSDVTKEIFSGAKDRDKISAQFLNQREIGVNGNKSRYVFLSPPRVNENEEIKNLPLIVLIPGISNDLGPIEALAKELAFKGREVVVIAYPESTLGKVSNEFVENMKKTEGFEAHAEFFKKAINKIVGDSKEISLWSHSTGGPIIADILSSDDEFRERVENAVLISPASAVDQSLSKLTVGVLKEVRMSLKNIPDLAKYSLVAPGNNPENKDQEKLKGMVFSSLINKITKKSNEWATMKVRDGGKIIIWSGEKDAITNSAKAHDLFEKTKQVETITDMGGTHLSALIRPVEVIEEIEMRIFDK